MQGAARELVIIVFCNGTAFFLKGRRTPLKALPNSAKQIKYENRI